MSDVTDMAHRGRRTASAPHEAPDRVSGDRPGEGAQLRDDRSGDRAVRHKSAEHGAGATEAATAAKPMSRGRKLLFATAALLAVGAAVTAGVTYWMHARHFESTDDAAIDGHIAQVSPQVGGRVISLAVEDNQVVSAGQLLIEIDPRDYQIRLDQAVTQYDQAVAQLEQMRAQVAQQRANIAQTTAQVRVTEADLIQAQQDLGRYRSIDPKAITRQQLDSATAQSRSASAKLDANRQAVAAAEAQLRAQQSQVANAEAMVRGNEVAVRNAKLQLSYTRITAPTPGRITRRSVDIGNYVNPGQLLLNVVPLGMWVTANFKETQLAAMRVGQPVDVRVDAVPDHVFHGRVDSFQTGTGSAFSTLPAENATGNYVKVVQRVPVKIKLDEADDPRLSPGLSVVPSVTVR